MARRFFGLPAARTLTRQLDVQGSSVSLMVHYVVLIAGASGSTLRGLDLHDGNLQKADLRGVDLTGADLEGADLR